MNLKEALSVNDEASLFNKIMSFEKSNVQIICLKYFFNNIFDSDNLHFE